MAVKYFIHMGIQFRTIDVAPSLLGLGGTNNIGVTVLEDVVFGLTDTGAFTPMLAGDSQTVKMNTLTSYWTTRQGGIQEVRRDVMNSRAPLLDPNPSDADDSRQTPATYNVHKEANNWILPKGFDQVIAIPNAANMPVGGQLLTLVEGLIYNHSNLEKFDTTAEAWEAYNNWFITQGLEDEIASTRDDYFVNPNLETAGGSS